jgi:hypothetical protein
MKSLRIQDRVIQKAPDFVRNKRRKRSQIIGPALLIKNGASTGQEFRKKISSQGVRRAISFGP